MYGDGTYHILHSHHWIGSIHRFFEQIYVCPVVCETLQEAPWFKHFHRQRDFGQVDSFPQNVSPQILQQVPDGLPLHFDFLQIRLGIENVSICAAVFQDSEALRRIRYTQYNLVQQCNTSSYKSVQSKELCKAVRCLILTSGITKQARCSGMSKAQCLTPSLCASISGVILASPDRVAMNEDAVLACQVRSVIPTVTDPLLHAHVVTATTQSMQLGFTSDSCGLGIVTTKSSRPTQAAEHMKQRYQ